MSQHNQTEEKIYRVDPAQATHSLIDINCYRRMYEQSINEPETFWAEQASQFLSFFEPWSAVYQGEFSKASVSWFKDAKLNVSYNCIDRHLPQRADQTAFIWEGDEPTDSLHVTYRELHQAVCRLANALKQRGVKKGDRVCIYMPMIPEAAYAMLACARIGAIHSVVFGGFSPDAIRDRILDSDCQTVITANQGLRGGKVIPLKENVDKALSHCPNVHSVIVVKRTDASTPWQESRDLWYHDAVAGVGDDCPPEVMDAEDPLFILYTSGCSR